MLVQAPYSHIKRDSLARSSRDSMSNLITSLFSSSTPEITYVGETKEPDGTISKKIFNQGYKQVYIHEVASDGPGGSSSVMLTCPAGVTWPTPAEADAFKKYYTDNYSSQSSSEQ